MADKLTGKYEPEEAIPKALDCARVAEWFVENGHLYSTYKVARLAGFEAQDAVVLAYFSQYPDIDEEFNAVNQFPKILSGKRSFVMEKLHSLHGGDATEVRQRRLKLRLLIEQHLSSGEFWKAGVLIHSLGDSYAHTKGTFGTSDEEAYGPLIGHGLPSIGDKIPGFNLDPDDLDRKVVREKYIAYINDLFEIMDRGNGDKVGFEDFVKNINVDQCVGKMCTTFKVLGPDDEALVDRFIKCMNMSLKSIDEDEMKQLYEQI
ncbi:DUF6765 family protein [Acinetobacter higginsii]|uniref:DUF6765 family protein n=1 Tax=Acinetobacter higginsii TaxID=70347 RepID=UPI0026747718|nr:DUF6765 family protein [Acinetobacter higginsii]MDO3663401.1 hypothetical protein [Acinetobacter higginsii]